ncbi:hypothetical protein PF008_g15072 [Phytophthora fragariae]|uniref:Uncharacterized protein n=1 Tax=Phytophthora fragariae TaxID=53985 RepID=A0A6G0RGI7_9STRA|nr:hypothetical protein PF008_g15072 [Phytophthora fragariae]
MLPSYQCSFCCLVAVSVSSNSIRYGISGRKVPIPCVICPHATAIAPIGVKVRMH